MKRALAERAKLLGDPNDLAPPPSIPTTSSTTSTNSPPPKVPRLERKDRLSGPEAVLNGSGANTHTSGATASRGTAQRMSPSTLSLSSAVISSQSPVASSSVPASGTITPKSNGSSTPRGSRSVKSLKRPRPSGRETDDEDDTQQNAFYLKHQNAALASELKQLQHQNKLLQNERDGRRNNCLQAVKAIQQLEATWSQMEAALQIRHSSAKPAGGLSYINGTQPNRPITPLPQGIPRSTGTGDSVEWIGALMDSLEKLKHDATVTTKLDNDQLQSFSNSISKRAACLQEWIWALLRRQNQPKERSELSLEVADLRKEISLLESQARRFQHQHAEMSHARDEARKSERRLRRGLYRLSAGRMELKEVMKLVEETSGTDDDAWLTESSPDVADNVPITAVRSTSNSVNVEHDSSQLIDLQKQLQDLEAVAISRQDQMLRLLGEQETNRKRINELLLSRETEKSQEKEPSEDDIKRSGVYTEMWVQMKTAERQVGEMKKKLEETKQMWGASRGDVDTALSGLEEHSSKHRKRWTELYGFGSDNSNFHQTEVVNLQKEAAELRHKLKQALESVRQSDTIRSSLEETMAINEALQTKLEESKQKTSSIMKMRENQSVSSTALHTAPDTVSRSDPNDRVTDKFHREHRKVRKELVAALQSKEHAKAKLERVEKERESLMKSNCQLLKQSAEKDDMNAKSLSTILHLKELTEKLSNEKDLLEQQVRSTEQVQLANRLATNARTRVMEEVVKERTILEQKVSGHEQECEHLRQARDRFEGSLSQKQAEIEQLAKHTNEARSRCDELVSQATKLQSEKIKLMEELAASRREALETARKFATLRERAADDGSSAETKTSEFTTDQLTTQINVLKNRLVCDVCNLRDKKCMIIRCRHMFCKPCVEENIKNRSRKCPACGQRFDTKDVVDIWL